MLEFGLELCGMVWRTLEEKRACALLRGRGTERMHDRENWQTTEHVANCYGRRKRRHVNPIIRPWLHHLALTSLEGEVNKQLITPRSEQAGMVESEV